MKNTMAMKLICMLLCVVMLGAMLAGCASGKQETAAPETAQTARGRNGCTRN